MTLTLELPSEKVVRFNERAQLTGLSPEEFARKIVELIVDTSQDEFESWMETLEVLSDKDFSVKLKQSMLQADHGQLTSWEDAKRELEIS